MRVLVIKTTSLGDVIHTLPALTDAALAYPNIEFDWVVEEPFRGTIRMCDVITLRDGKVISEELFYDSAKFPKEILEGMKANA